MNRTAILIAAGLAFAAALQSSPAQAQLLRTFVSAATGNDANSCDRTVPCRTFPGALAKTVASGEIYVLDPGGYGIVTIAQSVSIVSDGAGASIRVSSGATGITINAGVNDVINLRGLIIDGTGLSGVNGIQFNTGKSLTIENCVVRGVAGNGILFQPNASSSLAVSNTLVADNGLRGIRVFPSGAGTVKASFNRVEVYNNASQGLDVAGTSSTGTVDAIVTDSVAANNTGAGFQANSTSAATSLMVVRSVSANNSVGLAAIGANATARIGQSALTGNTNSWSAFSGAILRSYGDNNIDGNGDGDPAPTIIAKK